MKFKDDIVSRINADFGKEANEAITILRIEINKTDYLETDRVIRCIVFLAKGNLIELKKYIEMAALDTRDVMLAAEYEKLKGDLNYKRLKDCNKTFGNESDDVNE